MGLFEKIRNGLLKTKNAFTARIDGILKKFVIIDEDMLEELEEVLISADVGAEESMEIIDELRERIRDGRLKEPADVRAALREILLEAVGEGEEIKLGDGLTVILMIGVNGVGKTTSAAKLAGLYVSQGKKVVCAAADTFRAAASEQLAIWCDRVGCDLIKSSEGSDPAAVVFDAANAAKSRHADVLIIDTAGRLHNKVNLMNELSKINRVIDRELPESRRETLLVLDATTGQNAVIQAQEFKNVADITGIVLTKLDGSAKGGIIISIKKELDMPVKLIGVGEKADDLQPFVPQEFIDALFE